MFALSRIEWLVVAAALLLCPGFSWGAEADADLFDRLDRNKDGYLSPEELSSDEAANRNWIAIDRDRDGRISRTEFNAVVARTSQPQQPSSDAAAGATRPPSPKKE